MKKGELFCYSQPLVAYLVVSTHAVSFLILTLPFVEPPGHNRCVAQD